MIGESKGISIPKNSNER